MIGCRTNKQTLTIESENNLDLLWSSVDDTPCISHCVAFLELFWVVAVLKSFGRTMSTWIRLLRLKRRGMSILYGIRRFSGLYRSTTQRSDRLQPIWADW